MKRAEFATDKSCLGLMPAHGTLYHTLAGGSSDTAAKFQNIRSGWTFIAKGIIQYVDGTVEWDHSTDGEFKPLPEQ